jgi:exonuclease SbcD
MIKFLFLGDPHGRGNNPRNRIDDYRTAFFAKLDECFHIAEDEGVEAILCAGDMFDSFEVSIRFLLEVADFMKGCPVPFFITPGNHDIEGYNVPSWKRSSLRLLTELCNKVQVVDSPDKVTYFEHFGVRGAAVTFAPYSSKMDVDGYGYGPETGISESFAKIHIAHGMLLDHDPPFDRYTRIQDVQTMADLVLTGHDHIGYGIYKRADGVTFCNPGALMRKSASVAEMERSIQVALVTVLDETTEVKLIPIKSARPGEEVLDRSSLEAQKQRDYAMDEFTVLIKDQTGQMVGISAEDIIRKIGELNEFAPEVVAATLERIKTQREAGVDG